MENPVSIDVALDAARTLDAGHHAFVSLTGGEPLLQPEAVRAFAVALRSLGPRILLETHGASPDALGEVIGAIDVVSMDWKLAGEVRRASDPVRGPVEGFEAAHERALEIARRAPETVVKVVVAASSTDGEIDVAIDCVARVHPSACLVLQPVTPCNAVKEGVSAARLLALAARASQRLRDVRVIPQTHRMLGVA